MQGIETTILEALQAHPYPSFRAFARIRTSIEIRGTRIRLFEIYTPESRQMCANGRPWMCGRDAAMAR